MSMRLIRCTWMVVGLTIAFPTLLSPLRSSAAGLDAASVQRSIDRGIAYLRKTQNAGGNWDEYGGQSCGVTALCTLALLNAGVERNDPAILKAMVYLRGMTSRETYSISLQTLVYCQYGAAGDLPRIRKNVLWLQSAQKKDADFVPGAWGYGTGSGGDPSNAQFALLALGAAQDRGVDVEPAVFQRSLAYWTQLQHVSGGWGYGPSNPSGSMTCAGIASMIIARDGLGGESSAIDKDQIQCCGGADQENDPVERGVEWIAKNFNVAANPQSSKGTHFYYLYALERAARLSGRRFFGDHDWYREGAEQLLRMQDEFSGFWRGTDFAETDQNIATSFALLFLGKGKRQVVIGQMQYGKPTSRQWQRHPDGLRQVVRHVERRWRRDLTWQTVRDKNAKLQDLLQTPVLVISGREALPFSPEKQALLKEYIDQGGTILFDADGGNGCGDAAAFAKSVQEVCRAWYPNTKLERLPPTHPVWTAERKVDFDALPDDFWVYGIQACCRTAVFFVPQSLSCRWELSHVLIRRGEVSERVRDEIEQSVRIGMNLIAYATGRELKEKLEQSIVLGGESVLATGRGVTRLSMLAMDAGGEDADRALPNVTAIIRDKAMTRVAADADPVTFSSESLQEVAVLWVHGRTDFQWNDRQRKSLSEFVDNGGVILASSICGSEPFTKAFRREIQNVLPSQSLKTMPSSHPALVTTYDGFDLRRVTIRRPKQTNSGLVISKQTSPPILEYIEQDGVTSVIFSPLDISCALESQNSVQCPGYGTEDAAKIVTNIVLMTLRQ